MATLQVNSRAVLVDVLVTDKKGAPVRGLPQSAFSVKKQGKPQAITFFEEHQIASGTEQETVALSPNVFSNHPDEPKPAAVTVLLLDALNAPVEDQSFVHQQALQFLKTARPGMRMAIFTMSSGLHFVQGFTDDPAVLVTALNNTNGLASVIAEIGKSGADFYTLSYVCSRQRQDGRDISKHFGRGRRTEVQPELSARLFCHRRGPAGSGGERSCRSCGARRQAGKSAGAVYGSGDAGKRADRVSGCHQASRGSRCGREDPSTKRSSP